MEETLTLLTLVLQLSQKVPRGADELGLHSIYFDDIYLINIIIIINSLTMRVVGAPQMILQPAFSIFPCSPLPSGTYRTPDLPIP